MIDKDYVELRKVIQSELPEGMWLQDKTTDIHYKSDIYKIRDLNSCYIGASDTSWHNGLQLDIFLFEDKNKNIFDISQKRIFKKNRYLPIKRSII